MLLIQSVQQLQPVTFWNSPQFTQALIGLIGAATLYLIKRQGDLHLLVNSRLSELVETTKRAAFAMGQQDTQTKASAIAAGVAIEGAKHDSEQPNK